MTLVLSWIKFDASEPEVWTFADGKIMNDDTTLTLQGSKVLELHVRCKHLKGPPPRNIYFRSSIGFAYAGSTLTGFNTFATLTDVVSNLGGDQEKNHLPSYKDIIEKAKLILQKYTISSQSTCEILLFGFCPKTEKPFVCKIIPIHGLEGIEFKEEEVDADLRELQCVLLGDRINEVAGSILNISKDYKPEQYQYWNVPKAVFYDIVTRKLIDTVGGGMQLAIAYREEFQMNAITMPRSDDPTVNTIVHKDFDIFEDIGIKVGDCYFSMDSMDIGAGIYKKNEKEN